MLFLPDRLAVFQPSANGHPLVRGMFADPNGRHTAEDEFAKEATVTLNMISAHIDILKISGQRLKRSSSLSSFRAMSTKIDGLYLLYYKAAIWLVDCQNDPRLR